MRLLPAFLLLLLVSCTKVDTDVQPGACLTTCSDEMFLNETIQQQFGFTDFQVLCAECSAGRGGFVRAKLNVSGEEVAVYTQHGWCSSGGSDCGAQWCIATRDHATVNRLKENTCTRLNSFVVPPDDTCPGPQSNTTALAQERCMNGTFEEEEHGIVTFSVVQNADRCDASVEKGGSCLAE